MLYRALETDAPAVQDKCLTILPTFASLIGVHIDEECSGAKDTQIVFEDYCPKCKCKGRLRMFMILPEVACFAGYASVNSVLALDTELFLKKYHILTLTVLNF